MGIEVHAYHLQQLQSNATINVIKTNSLAVVIKICYSSLQQRVVANFSIIIKRRIMHNLTVNPSL